MLLPILSATLPEPLSQGGVQALLPWIALAGFGAYHGLNPGMGWLFALSLGLQQRSERAIWLSLLPIALGHLAAIALTAVAVWVGLQFISLTALQWLTALVLLGFGIYKVFTSYRHPKWVGMRVEWKDLVWWSFLMALAHGAGLMVAPTLVEVGGASLGQAAPLRMEGNMALAMGVHTVAMLVIMAVVAWLVYRKLGLMILRRGWVNFDLLWAGALMVVGLIALLNVATPELFHGGHAIDTHAGHGY